MRSFPYWILSAVALGVVVGAVIHPGVPEIVIVWLASLALLSFWRRLSRQRLTSQAG
jgi:hypothetical protein